MSDNLQNIKEVYLKAIQLKSLNSIIPHLAVENVYNSNLIDDIGYVDYTENSKGLTCLKPLKGIPDFIDDLYIFKYIHVSEIDQKTINEKKIYLNQGKDESAALIVKQIKIKVKESFNISCDDQKTAFLVNLQNEKEREKSIIYQTVKGIERRTDSRAFKGYKNKYNCKNPVAIIKYKIDTSSLPIKKVIDNLENFERNLNSYGAGLMSIDYTRDLSGVLEKKRMVDHFLKMNFIEQSTIEEEENNKYYITDEFTQFKLWKEKTIKNEDNEENKSKIKILDSDSTCGRNTFKYVKFINGLYIAVKFYNKIVSNFEAGNVQNKTGSHLAEYAFTHSNEHLEKIFRHPDVVERGMTRLEISIHGFNPNINYSYMLDEEFSLVKNVKIFHIQPGAEQWLRLTKHITQCALFANKSTLEIYMFWYGSSVTKRLAGVTKKLKKEYVDANPKEWENAIEWFILNFGFSGVPIYKIILDIEEPKYKGLTFKERKEEEQPQEEQKEEQEEEQKEEQKEEQEEEQKEEQKEEQEEEQKEEQEEEQKEEQEEEQKEEQEEEQKEEQKEEQPKRKRGRPTRRETEERRSKLTEEEREAEDELKARRRQQREERKRIKAEELAAEIERLENLTREEREEEERKKRIDEERKQELEERKKEKEKKEGLKMYITNFSYCLKKGPTYLTPFGQPTKMYISNSINKIKEPPCSKDEIFNYPSRILPDTKHIQWRFRTESDHKRIGKKKLPKNILVHFENPGKGLSIMSTRERNNLINLKNEDNRRYIKETAKFTIEAKRRQRNDIKNRIKTDLKETETIALYEERKDTIDGVFRCFTNPGEIDKVLNENEYIHIFAFKVYPNCTRIAYKVQDEIKVCFANPLIKYMLDGLRDTCFNMLPKEETKYKPEYPVYFMRNASLKAKGEDGTNLKIIDEIDGTEVKNFNETLNQHFGDWEELRRLEKLKTPKMEEVFEEVVKPTQTVKLEP